jgi:hypothetical protein
MLETAAEREKEAEVLQIAIDAMEKHDKAFKELAAIEAAEREEVAEFLDVMAEEAFANLGEQDFFEAPRRVEPPAIHTPIATPYQRIPKAPRYIPRSSSRSRKG